MKTKRPLIIVPAAILAAALLGACVAARRGPPAAQSAPAEKRGDAFYYSDLGPDAVDVSSYPIKQQYNYLVFSRVCSQCHTLARPLNAPAVSRGYWDFYLLRMKLYSRFAHQPISLDESRAILDFLEYDARIRKVKNRKQFQDQTDELKRRFDSLIEGRLRRYQEDPQQPLLYH